MIVRAVPGKERSVRDVAVDPVTTPERQLLRRLEVEASLLVASDGGERRLVAVGHDLERPAGEDGLIAGVAAPRDR